MLFAALLIGLGFGLARAEPWWILAVAAFLFLLASLAVGAAVPGFAFSALAGSAVGFAIGWLLAKNGYASKNRF
jgi:uncharacterized membrane protein YccC